MGGWEGGREGRGREGVEGREEGMVGRMRGEIGDFVGCL